MFVIWMLRGTLSFTSLYHIIIIVRGVGLSQKSRVDNFLSRKFVYYKMRAQLQVSMFTMVRITKARTYIKIVFLF